MRDLRRGLSTQSNLPLFLILTAALLRGQDGLPAIVFEDVTADSGAGFQHAASPTQQKYLPEAMGAGVAVFDFDNDGKLDLFFVNGAELPDKPGKSDLPGKTSPKYWNRLYRNLGGWKFQDVTEAWKVAGEGYGMGVTAGDFDNDGRTDLYVTAYGRNYLYRNTGSAFEEIAAAAGVRGSGWSTGAAFFDYDRDGHLDLFVARYLDWSFASSRWCGEGSGAPRAYCHPRFFGAAKHVLFHNRGDGTFEDVSDRIGISSHPGKGLGVKIADVDGDGWSDIVVANDSAPQQLFLNRGGKSFEEAGLKSGIAYDEDGHTYAGMGLDSADVDGNGRPDLFVNALARQGYWLYTQHEPGAFEVASSKSGLEAITSMRSGWGVRLADFDNDGWPDLAVAQGHVMDTVEWNDPAVHYKEPPLLAKNLFGKFFDVSATAGPAFSSSHARAGRGLATGDLDGDGLLDIVINNNNARPTILRNRTASKHRWVSVELRGSRGNRTGLGAAVTLITSDGKRVRKTVEVSGSYLSSSSPLAHFGLGDEAAQVLEIDWPSGAKSRVVNPKGIMVVEEPQSR